MMKIVLNVQIFDEKMKTKAMKAVSGISGVESVSVDMKDKKLTLTGNIDAVCVAGKLRKLCHTDIISVGPAKEEKKEEPKKPEEKKKDPNDITDLVKAYEAYYTQMRPPYYYVGPVQENPNTCVIC